MTKTTGTKSSKRALWLAAGIIVLTVAAAGCAGSGNQGSNGEGNNGSSTRHQNDGQAGGSPANDAGSVNGGTADNSASGSGSSGGTANSGSGANDSVKPDNGGQTGQNGGTGDTAGEAAKKGQGVYIGQVDTHSVEIDTDQGATVYQIDDKIADQLNALDDHTTVAFEYTEKVVNAGGKKVTQLWLTKIEAVKNA